MKCKRFMRDVLEKRVSDQRTPRLSSDADEPSSYRYVGGQELVDEQYRSEIFGPLILLGISVVESYLLQPIAVKIVPAPG